MWSFVGSKKNKEWIWLALDQGSKKVVGAYIGSRDKKGAKGLWDSLPPVYRQCAFGLHTKRFFHQKGIKQLTRKVVK